MIRRAGGAIPRPRSQCSGVHHEDDDRDEGVDVEPTTILLVEDESRISELVRTFLVDRGYTVYRATDGNQALELWREVRPDALILDIMIPGCDGMKVCRAIRRESNVPIIMLTARSEEIDKLLGLELGADDYVTKPFSVRELEARLRAVLRRFQAAGDSPSHPTQKDDGELLKFGALAIDQTGQRVWRNEEEIRLTPTEFRLLVTLASNPGRVFSRMQLLDSAFGEAYVGYERSVDTHISNLRKKLEPEADSPRYISTVHGFGYRFDGAEVGRPR